VGGILKSQKFQHEKTSFDTKDDAIQNSFRLAKHVIDTGRVSF